MCERVTMPILVHLTSEKNRRSILSAGIRGQARQISSANGKKLRDLHKAVFCMPVMPNYVITHQWLRELHRHQDSPRMIGIYFRLPKDEPVWVGRFSEPHKRMPLGKAIRLLMDETQPLGCELILPRSITPKEIHKIRSLPRITGWRFMPDRNAYWCLCDYCLRGRPNAQRRIAYVERVKGINYQKAYGKIWAKTEDDD